MQLKPYVKISGSGPVLMLIHGWGLNGGIWQTILPQLEQEFTVYNLDLPGFGNSAICDGDYNLESLVEAVESVLPEQPCYLMGWSLGGLVATAVALKRPNKIKKLISVASNPAFVATQNWPHGMKAEILDSFITSLHEDFDATLNRFLSIQTMGSPTRKEDVRQLKQTLLECPKPDEKALAGGLKILKESNLVERLSELVMPTLRIYGRLDSLVPVKVAASVDKLLPQSRAIVYRRSAHAPFITLPQDFVSDVIEFLSEEPYAEFTRNEISRQQT